MITKFKYERKNEKDSGRSSKMKPSCKWPIGTIHADIIGFQPKGRQMDPGRWLVSLFLWYVKV